MKLRPPQMCLNSRRSYKPQTFQSFLLAWSVSLVIGILSFVSFPLGLWSPPPSFHKRQLPFLLDPSPRMDVFFRVTDVVRLSSSSELWRRFTACGGARSQCKMGFLQVNPGAPSLWVRVPPPSRNRECVPPPPPEDSVDASFLKGPAVTAG